MKTENLRTLWLILVALMAVFVGGCSAVPPEATQSAALLEQSAKANAETRVRMVRAYSANLKAIYAAQLRLIAERELAKINADTDAAARLDAQTKLLAQMDEKRTAFEADIDAKGREFLDDPNQAAELALAAALNRYVAALDHTAREFQAIVEQAQGMFATKKGTTQ